MSNLMDLKNVLISTLVISLQIKLPIVSNYGKDLTYTYLTKTK